MVTDALATAPGPFLNNLPIQKEVKQYENKEYATLKEYVRAFEEGKCSSVWLWMHMPQDGKIDLIEGLKQIYKDKENNCTMDKWRNERL